MKSGWFSAVVLCSLIAVASVMLLLSGCSHSHTPVAPGPPGPIVSQTAPPGHVLIYRLALGQAEMSGADANGLIGVAVPIPAKSTNPGTLAIEALQKTQESPLPPGTKLNSLAIDQANGLATIDFSSEFKKNFSGGDAREAQAINSVLATLGQFNTIEDVQFLVDGQKIASLGGTQDLNDPLPVIHQSALASSTTDGGAQP